MKKYLLLLFLISECFCFAQITAVTEKGDSVILNQNGSWQFLGSPRFRRKAEADTNKIQFVKPESSRKVLKGQNIDYELWYDADIWKMSSDDESEFSLASANGAAYFFISSTGIPATIDEIRYNMINSIYYATDDIKITDEEFRIVNGTPVYMMIFKASVEEVEEVYVNYYYYGKKYTLSASVFTMGTAYEKNKRAIENLLNGLVINEKQ